MKNHSPIYDALWIWLSQGSEWAHKTHLTNCISMLIALIKVGGVNLTQWIPYLPCRGKYAQSQQRRLQRWLHNSRINVHRLYQPLIESALSEWKEERMYLSLDTSLFWEDYCLVRLAVVHRGRAIPVVWRVMKHESATVAFDDYWEMLTSAANRLPSGVKMVLLADRGFMHRDLMKALKQEWGWHYRIRLKKDCWIWAGKGCSQLKDYHFQPGQALCLQNVRLYKEQPSEPVNIIIGRNNANGEFWAIVSDEETTLQTYAEYGLRFDIEESFLDDQSNGWNVQRSQIRSVCALSRLFFLLAVATLYLTAQGVEVVTSGKRRWVDPHWFRGNSYFRIGWQWVKSAMVRGLQLIHYVVFTGNVDPHPAKASRRQHQQRRDRFQFQVQSFNYASA